jgi:hypothetical protein
MDNRIREVGIWDRRLDPAEAEVCITVVPERLTSTTQVRGRLMGPRCPYATTVEVAYSLRECSRQYESEGPIRLIHRVIIPEPNFWDPQSPFLYQGPLELWQGGQCCDRVEVRHGLCVVSLGPRGLNWNGRPLTLRGVSRGRFSEDEARALHGLNRNLVLTPAADTTFDLWGTADRFGLLILNRVADRAELLRSSPPAECACGLGWLLGPELLNDEPVRIGVLPLADPFERRFAGVELDQPPAEPLPKQIAFVVCPEAALPALAEVGLPKIVLREAGDGESSPPWAATPGIMGWIDR